MSQQFNAKKSWGGNSGAAPASATTGQAGRVQRTGSAPAGQRPSNQTGEIVYRVKKAGASRDDKMVTVANLFKNTDNDTGKITYRLSLIEDLKKEDKYFTFENTPYVAADADKG